jgi:hypothetical protein
MLLELLTSIGKREIFPTPSDPGAPSRHAFLNAPKHDVKFTRGNPPTASSAIPASNLSFIRTAFVRLLL